MTEPMSEKELKEKLFEVDFAVPLLEREKSETNVKHNPKSVCLNGRLAISVSDLKEYLKRRSDNWRVGDCWCEVNECDAILNEFSRVSGVRK